MKFIAHIKRKRWL